MTAQLSLGEFAPVGTFVFIDFVTVVTFTWLANAYNKIWIWWIAAFHTLSLGVNFAFVLNGQESTYLYLSLMTGLSYLSLLWIFTGEKLSQLIGKGVKSGFASINPSSVRSSRDTNHES
ncbi:MAG: hypothetical protein JKY52_08295 [Flavobacteriales bacterium]|nr:hypothetical protein [Flavobacteriales bacterium]